MVDENEIRNAYTHIRKTNETIDPDVLDFMKDASLSMIKLMKKKNLV